MFKMLQWIFGGKVDVDAGGVPLLDNSSDNTDGLRNPPSVEMVETTSKVRSVSDVLPVHMSVYDDVLRKAEFLYDKWHDKCIYRMGAEFDGSPVACDCSSYVNNSCGWKKYHKKSGCWFNTDKIVSDAQGKHLRFKQIPEPVNGCIGVYAGKTDPATKKRKPGHTWIVKDVEKRQTLECSSSQNGIAQMTRKMWFTEGARSSSTGQPIIWVVPVEGAS